MGPGPFVQMRGSGIINEYSRNIDFKSKNLPADVGVSPSTQLPPSVPSTFIAESSTKVDGVCTENSF